MISRKWILALIAVLLIATTSMALAQDNVVLQIAVPELTVSTYQGVVDQFEAETGIHVQVNTFPNIQIPLSPQGDVESYLDGVADYVSASDVILVNSSVLTPEATLAGYFLDLSPLANSDPSLNVSDFYPAMWKSFQWDNGIWALPVSGDYVGLFYDPSAFDAAGLAYPNDSWTIQDVDNAIRTLTQVDEDGKVVQPGFLNFGGDLTALALSLLGEPMFDDSVYPPVPRFVDPRLEEMLTVWMNIQADGLLNIPQDGSLDLNAIPMVIGPSFFSLATLGTGENARVPAFLPGGRVGISVEGFAVSIGTQYPEAAYELAKYMTSSPEAANASFLNSIPARISLAGVEPSGEGLGSDIRAILGNPSEEYKAMLPLALERAIPASEARYSQFLTNAATKMLTEDVDAATALQEVQKEILDRIDFAVARHDEVNIVVNPPDQTPDLVSGEVAIKFGATAFVTPFPDQDKWQAVAQEFAANDPEVGAVILDTAFPPVPNTLSQLADKYDCFFIPSNMIPDADLSLIRSIDPLLASDPSFDPNDMVGNIMSQVRRNDQTWAFPITVQPLVLRYNVDMFNHAGAFLPFNGWQVSDFEDALRTLKDDLGEDTQPFYSQSFDNSYLMALIVAYGGLPFDYRTTPATVNFTDPSTVEAIRQVLNLIDDGYISYTSSSSGGVRFALGNNEQHALYTETLSGLGIGAALSFGSDNAGTNNPDGMVTFPGGTKYNVVSYDIGAAYISANTENTEACYRFISYLAQNTQLFSEMPARRSMINSPEILASQGETAVAFYNNLDQLMQQSNTIEIPSLSLGRGTSTFLEGYWLNRAFDHYLNDNADLEAELADAQLFTTGFQECAAQIPPFDPEQESQVKYAQRFSDCATRVDPTVEGFLGLAGN